jgi:hypothetical protein
MDLLLTHGLCRCDDRIRSSSKWREDRYISLLGDVRIICCRIAVGVLLACIQMGRRSWGSWFMSRLAAGLGFDGWLSVPTVTHGDIINLNVFHVVKDVSSSRALGAWMDKKG